MDASTDSIARRNVLVFYGVGGVGKSTLSERLEAWVHNELPLLDPWGPRPSTRVAASARVNLEGSGGNFDVEAVVVAIRQRLGRVNRGWPAFDFAFAGYWAAAHPGLPVPGAGTEADAGFEGAVTDIIRAVVGDIGSLDSVTAVGLQSVRLAVREMRRRQTRRLAFASLDGYADLLDRCTTVPTPDDPRPDLLIDLVTLLDNDLRTWRDGASPLVVVFIDTLERLWLDRRRVGEGALNQIVYNMPNVLFVMTGRNMLEWCDQRRATLHHAGPGVWPGLVPGAVDDPRQHAVGNLSRDDTRGLILRARQRFELPIPDDVVEELVKASGGLPQYLDLARAVATIVKDNGVGPVSVSDVTGSVGDLVMRVLEDIPEDEQRALRAAALFAYFDPGLIAAAGGVTHGCAERAVHRPMIDHRPDHLYPYRMHEEIRAAIRFADHRIPGGWAAGDWEEAAERGVREARRRHEAAVHRGDGLGVLSSIGLAVGLVCDFEVRLEPPDNASHDDWLTQAILFGPSAPGLRPYVPATATTPYGQVVLDFILARTFELQPEERYGHID